MQMTLVYQQQQRHHKQSDENYCSNFKRKKLDYK